MKVILIGDYYYRRIFEPLINLGYEVKLIRYDYKAPKLVQPFMYFYGIIQIYVYTLFFFKSDIILFTNPSYFSFFTIDFLRLMKKKVIIRLGADLKHDYKLFISHFHGFSPRKLTRIIQHRMLAYSIKKSNELLTPSEYVKQQTSKDYDISLDKIHCIYTPIDSQKKLYLQAKKNIILSVTQFNNPLKTQGSIDAIKHLSGWLKTNPHYKYIIVGAGKNYKNVKKWKKENHDLPNIIFAGYVKNIEAWYLKAKIFIHISYSDGFPIVVLEAQVYGLPVIANNDVGMKEQIVHNHNGFLIDNGELHTISKYLNTLIQDEKIYENISANCTDYVSKNYNLDIVSERIHDALKFN